MRWPGAHHPSAPRRTEADQGRFLPVRPARQLVLRVGLWGLVGLGGVGGVVGMLGAARSHPSPDPPASAASSVPVDVAGFAQLAVGVWLGAGPDDAATMNALFAVDPEPGGGGSGRAEFRGRDLATVAAREVASGYWAVTVAAAVDERIGETWQPAGMWFLELGVVKDGGGGLLAVSEPAVVPAPPAPRLGPSLEAPNLAGAGPGEVSTVTAVEGFLRALLLGDGDLTRYLAPDVRLAAVSPAPFTKLSVGGVAVTELSDATRVRVALAATTSGGTVRSLGYEVTLSRRDERWEVIAISGAPALRDAEAQEPMSTPASTAPGASTSIALAPGA